eukprot:scaffold7674_cov37-Tisochrysis_lutea.AAC.2
MIPSCRGLAEAMRLRTYQESTDSLWTYLVNPGLVREGVGAHDCLVRLNSDARVRCHHLGGAHDLAPGNIRGTRSLWAGRDLWARPSLGKAKKHSMIRAA